MSTRAVILAAGRGSRLGQLGESLPKCLIEIQGKPILRHQLDALKHVGVREVVVVGGYRIEDLKSSAYSLVENPYWESSTMVTSLELGLVMPTEMTRTVVLYGDVYVEGKSLQQLPMVGGDITVGYTSNWKESWTCRYSNPFDDLESFHRNRGGRLTAIGERVDTFSGINGQFAGLLWLSRKGESQLLDAAQRLRPHSTTNLISQLIQQNHQIGTVHVKPPWFEIDTESDLQYAKITLAGRAR